jgi:hypothetical protein
VIGYPLRKSEAKDAHPILNFAYAKAVLKSAVNLDHAFSACILL